MIMRVRRTPSVIAAPAVTTRGAHRFPTGLINNHCVATIEALVYESNQPTCDDVNSHFCTK